MSRPAVLTIAAGRHGHLRRQAAGLAAGERVPDVYVVAAMGDPEIAGTLREPGAPLRSEVVELPAGDIGLPLAAARNAAARRAVDAGADTLIFLDVDCIPGPGLVAGYVHALERAAREAPGPHVIGGTVTYLPPAPAGGYPLTGLDRLATPHAARPAPAPGTLTEAADLRLFWSLSFAVTADDWVRLGGFCERYTGYGGEDTDFAMVLAAAGGRLWWSGDAPAFHQHHPSESPPRRHLRSILRNAAIFHSRWGWFPMEGWLAAFEREGLVYRDDEGTWREVAASRR